MPTADHIARGIRPRQVAGDSTARVDSFVEVSHARRSRARPESGHHPRPETATDTMNADPPKDMNVHDPRTVDWSQRDFTEVRPGIQGSTVHTPQLTATLYRYGSGSSWEEHEHPQDQITTVLEGSIDFFVAGELVRLNEGETALLPGGVRHAAEVPSTTGAVTLNVLTRRDNPPARA